MSPSSETAHGQRLVIVESPTKAKTIKGYLGPGYIVEASVGHIRDLPSTAAEVPDKYTGEVRRLGVDVDHDFAPIYVVNADKKSQVSKLKSLLAESDELFLATDEDREGEAIAWHLQQVLKPKVPVHRMVFHEITKAAIQEAVANPRELNQRLVDAQETRRILDRLYGFEVSPVLWKKVMPKLSAGRVQSVATRLVVERERERMAFRSASYWDLVGTFGTGRTAADAANPENFGARLSSVDGKRIASGRDFGQDGLPRRAAPTPCTWTSRPPARWPPPWSRPRSRCAASSPSRTAARRTRRSAPRRSSRRPAASWASVPSGPCRWPRSCTRTASSPTCVPTPPRCRRPRSTPPGRRSPSSTAPTTCRTRPAPTPPR